jgi:hypothetical protein
MAQTVLRNGCNLPGTRRTGVLGHDGNDGAEGWGCLKGGNSVGTYSATLIFRTSTILNIDGGLVM